MTWPCGQCLVSAPSSDAAFAADDRSVTPSVGPTTTTTTPPSRPASCARSARSKARSNPMPSSGSPRGSGGVSALGRRGAEEAPSASRHRGRLLPAPVRVADEDDTSRAEENSQEPSNPTREGHNERRRSGGEAAPSPRWVPPPERRTRSARGRADSSPAAPPRARVCRRPWRRGRRRRRSAREEDLPRARARPTRLAVRAPSEPGSTSRSGRTPIDRSWTSRSSARARTSRRAAAAPSPDA